MLTNKLSTILFILKNKLLSFLSKKTTGLSFSSDEFNNVNIDDITTTEFNGEYEKKGRVKYSPKLHVVSYRPSDDVVNVVIDYGEGKDSSPIYEMPAAILENYFKQIK